MQNMIQFLRYEKPVRVFFDLDHEADAVNNISVLDDSNRPMRLTNADREALIDVIRENVAIEIIQFAMDKKRGRVANA